jgi:hypothetical protein
MKIIRFLLILFFGLWSFTADAQEYSLTGTMIDSISGDVLPFAHVRLLNQTDSSLYMGTISEENGMFFLKDIKKGEWICWFAYLGYDQQCRNIVFSREKQVNLGKIRLTEKRQSLTSVEIADHNRISIKPDRTVYYIDSVSLAGTTSTIDLLKKIPDLHVNQTQDEVDIKGLDGTIVMLNGILNPSKVKLRNIDPQSLKNRNYYKPLFGIRFQC